jgi:hypothetical protein
VCVFDTAGSSRSKMTTTSTTLSVSLMDSVVTKQITRTDATYFITPVTVRPRIKRSRVLFPIATETLLVQITLRVRTTGSTLPKYWKLFLYSPKLSVLRTLVECRITRWQLYYDLRFKKKSGRGLIYLLKWNFLGRTEENCEKWWVQGRPSRYVTNKNVQSYRRA